MILAQPTSLRSAGALVLGFSVVLAVVFLRSHFARDYPPPMATLETWLETWGEFGILPFVKIPAEKYRLAQAIFVIPMILAAWMLMGGTARLMSVVFGGKLDYEQYLSLFAYSFFPFWILGHLFDILYGLILGDIIVPALRVEYGPVVKALVAGFPPVMWTAVLTLGGVYNGIVTHEGEGFVAVKSGLTGTLTFFWPIVLIATLIR